jgi:hypothetical protein
VFQPEAQPDAQVAEKLRFWRAQRFELCDVRPRNELGFLSPETAKICFSAASSAIAANAVESMQRHRRFRPFFTNP